MSRGQVYVVDDDILIGQAICDLVQTVDLAGRAFSTGQRFLDAYAEDRPTVAVIDVRLPGLGGLALQKRLAEQGAVAPVIFVTAFGDAWTAVTAMKGGAFDFFEKPFKEQELLSRIQDGIAWHAAKLRERQRPDAGEPQADLAPAPEDAAAVEVERFLAAARRAERQGILAFLEEPAPPPPPGGNDAAWGLAPRQVEILMALRDGASNKEIGRRMGILEATVKVQLKAIFRALGVANRTQAALAASRYLAGEGATEAAPAPAKPTIPA